jgi:hypothetical protein
MGCGPIHVKRITMFIMELLNPLLETEQIQSTNQTTIICESLH